MVAKEGYMFPDTYLIPKDASPAAIASMFFGKLSTKVTTQMFADAKKMLTKNE